MGECSSLIKLFADKNTFGPQYPTFYRMSMSCLDTIFVGWGFIKADSCPKPNHESSVTWLAVRMTRSSSDKELVTRLSWQLIKRCLLCVITIGVSGKWAYWSIFAVIHFAYQWIGGVPEINYVLRVNERRSLLLCRAEKGKVNEKM